MSPFKSHFVQHEFIISNKYNPKVFDEVTPKYNNEFISGSSRNKKPSLLIGGQFDEDMSFIGYFVISIVVFLSLYLLVAHCCCFITGFRIFFRSFVR